MEPAETGGLGRARVEAGRAIQLLGPFANAPVSTGTLAWFGHWLDWPAWLRNGTSLPEGARQLPDRITAADDLIMTANIIDHGDADAMLVRLATGQALAAGPITLLANSHAPMLGDFARMLPRFAASSTPIMDVCLQDGADEWEISLTSRYLAGSMLGFASLVGLLQCGRMLAVSVNDPLQAIRIETSWPSSGTGAAAELPGPWQMTFDAACNRLLFPARWAAVANPAHDAGVWLLVQERVQAAATAWQLQADIARIRELVGAFIDREQRVPRFKQLAMWEAMSERSLSRLMASAGTSFQAIVDAERRARAVRLINNPGLSQADMAAALGFPDVSSFGRSFRRWFGKPPGEFRRSLAGDGDTRP
jgi:AraC-like DNA-binding protein